MQTYLILKERVAGFRADPAVQEALRASQVGELATPTLGDAESYLDLLADRSAFEDFDLKTAAVHGFGFAHLDQLAVEHVLGAR
jgi:xylose isomerase